MIRITDNWYCTRKEFGGIEKYFSETDPTYGYWYLIVYVHGEKEEILSVRYNSHKEMGEIRTKEEAKAIIDNEFYRIKKEYDEAID